MDRGKLIERLRDAASARRVQDADVYAAEAMERAADKIEGLDADLFEAVQVAYRRGAVEWARLNYKGWIERLEANARSRPIEAVAGDAREGVRDASDASGQPTDPNPNALSEPPRPTREEVARAILQALGHHPEAIAFYESIVAPDCRLHPDWALGLKLADPILALFSGGER